MATKRILSLTALTLAGGLCYAGLAGALVIIPEDEPNNSLGSAQEIMDADFSLDGSFDIGDISGNNTSGTIPHVTIRGLGGDGTVDYYSFMVSTAGSRVILDIDDGGTGDSLDTKMAVWDPSGHLVTTLSGAGHNSVVGDDSLVSMGASGSLSFGGESPPESPDPFLEGILGDAGLYVVGVTEVGGDVAFSTGDSLRLDSNCQHFDFPTPPICLESSLSEGGWYSEVNNFLGTWGPGGGLTQVGSSYTLHISVDESDVPEPTTLALLGLGLAGMGFGARRRKH